METILYATDCSEHTVPALRYAYMLSNKLKASLVVLKVYDTSVTHIVQKLEKYAFEEQTAILKEFCTKHLGNELEKMNVRPEAMKHISIVEGILEKSKELQADMIIAGVKHKNSQRGFFEGNIAKALITKASSPLLIVPGGIKSRKIEQMVYATDFEQDDIFAIKKLIAVAKVFGSEIHVIHITTKNEYAVEDQMEWFKEMLQQKVSYDHINFSIFSSDNIYETLYTCLGKVEADLLVMLKREEHHPLRKLFHRDLVKYMESRTGIPLLCFNRRNLQSKSIEL